MHGDLGGIDQPLVSVAVRQDEYARRGAGHLRRDGGGSLGGLQPALEQVGATVRLKAMDGNRRGGLPLGVHGAAVEQHVDVVVEGHHAQAVART